jgi:hypothetical protein
MNLISNKDVVATRKGRGFSAWLFPCFHDVGPKSNALSTEPVLSIPLLRGYRP